jgi:MFS family permease
LKSYFRFLRGNVLIITITIILYRFVFASTAPYFSLYILALGGSPSVIGLTMSLGGLAGMLLYPIGGYIADHRGRVKIVGLTTFFYAATFLLYSFAMDWMWIMAGQFTSQLTLFYIPAMNAIMADSMPREQRGTGFAITSAIPQVIAILVPYISGYMTTIYGLEFTCRIWYGLGAVVGLITGVLRYKFLEETLPATQREPFKLQNIPRVVKDSYVHTWESFKWMPKSLKSFSAVTLMIILVISMVNPYWVVYAKQVIMINEYEWGIIMLCLGIVSVIFSLPAGKLIDKIGSRKSIMIALSTALTSAIAFPFCTDFTHTLVATIPITIANTILFPATMTLMTNTVPRERRGTLMALIGQGVGIAIGQTWAQGSMQFLALSIGSIVGGQIYEVNPTFPWYALTISFIICLIVSYFFVHEPEESQE